MTGRVTDGLSLSTNTRRRCTDAYGLLFSSSCSALRACWHSSSSAAILRGVHFRQLVELLRGWHTMLATSVRRAPWSAGGELGATAAATGTCNTRYTACLFEC
jgi:hypothetical protein